MRILHISDTHNLEQTLELLSQKHEFDRVYLTGDNGKNASDWTKLLRFLGLDHINDDDILMRRVSHKHENVSIVKGNHDTWVNNLYVKVSDVPVDTYQGIIQVYLPFGKIPDSKSEIQDLDKCQHFWGLYNDDSKAKYWHNHYEHIMQEFDEEIFCTHEQNPHVLMHTPIFSTDGNEFFRSTEALDIMRKHQHKVFHVFSGHIHKNMDVAIDNVIQHVTCGSRIVVI